MNQPEPEEEKPTEPPEQPTLEIVVFLDGNDQPIETVYRCPVCGQGMLNNFMLNKERFVCTNRVVLVRKYSLYIIDELVLS